MTEREFATAVVRTLQNAGHLALWAGGCVRDELLKITPKDHDVATSARPEEVRRLFRRTIAVGMSFGVIEVLGPKSNDGFIKTQVATFRSDGAYSDGRHPDSVVFSSAKEDAWRRDFTINGMFYDPIKNELLDYVGGQDDLNKKILRAIGDPYQRFAEDKLRLLRAVRMATRFDLTIEAETEKAIRLMADQIRIVSAERIAEELRQILVHEKRVPGVQLLSDLGLLEPIVPELTPVVESHSWDVPANAIDEWKLTLETLKHLGPAPSFPLAFACLLRRIPSLRPSAESSYTKSAGMTVHAIAERLRLSNAERDQTEWLVVHQSALHDVRHLRLSELKRLLNHPHIEELLQMHEADARARRESNDDVEYCRECLQKWTKDDLDPPPILTGGHLKKRGIKPGPQFKTLLEAVREAQLNETISTEAEAWEIVERILKDRND